MMVKLSRLISALEIDSSSQVWDRAMMQMSLKVLSSSLRACSKSILFQKRIFDRMMEVRGEFLLVFLFISAEAPMVGPQQAWCCIARRPGVIVVPYR